jgi:hypothetical protein
MILATFHIQCTYGFDFGVAVDGRQLRQRTRDYCAFGQSGYISGGRSIHLPFVQRIGLLRPARGVC